VATIQGSANAWRCHGEREAHIRGWTWLPTFGLIVPGCSGGVGMGGSQNDEENLPPFVAPAERP